MIMHMSCLRTYFLSKKYISLVSRVPVGAIEYMFTSYTVYVWGITPFYVLFNTD